MPESHWVMLEWNSGCLSQNGFHQTGTAVFSVDEFACVELRFTAVRIQDSSPKSDITDVTRGLDAFHRMYSGSSGVQPLALSIIVSLLKSQLRGLEIKQVLHSLCLPFRRDICFGSVATISVA